MLLVLLLLVATAAAVVIQVFVEVEAIYVFRGKKESLTNEKFQLNDLGFWRDDDFDEFDTRIFFC